MLTDLVAAARRRSSDLDPERLRRAAETRGPARPFRAALQKPGLAVIAEIKRASPSRGLLDAHLEPGRLAARYAAGGAAALSVLTEPDSFLGSLTDLEEVGRAVDLPVLRKDFVVEPVQIWETRAAGADAVLLITAALDDAALEKLLREAGTAGLEALVEVHTEPEVRRALAAGATVIGVNNRDLATFEVDLATAERLAPLVGGAATLVAESGIWSRPDAARMATAGFDAVLVGESLVRSEDPAALVAELRRAT